MHAINTSLGNLGETVTLHAPRDRGPADRVGSLSDLARDIDRGAVDTLLILGANPAYDAPADLDFAAALAGDKIKLRIHLGLYEDETAELCHWHIPEAHFLETWSDIRAFDGTATIQQPLIAPLVPGPVRARGARGLPRASRTGPAWRSSATTGSASRSPATSRPPGSGPCARATRPARRPPRSRRL